MIWIGVFKRGNKSSKKIEGFGMKVIMDQFSEGQHRYTRDLYLKETEDWGPIWKQMAKSKVNSKSILSKGRRLVILYAI